MKIILGPSSKELGERIAQASGLEKIPIVSKTFPDGEAYIRLEGDVQNNNVCIIQTTSPPQHIRLLQLAFIANAAKRNGAKKVTAVVPYLAYARQDKIFLKGETISIEVIARMLSSVGIDELLTVNIHQENALSKFPFPAKSISAIPLLAEYFVQRGFKKAFALAPDKGAMYIADQAKNVLGGENGHLEKERDRYTGQVKIAKKEFNVKGSTVIIFDDIISTGGTIVNAAKILSDLGAARIFAACVHPLLIGDAEKRILDAGVEEIIGTDSVPNKTSKVTLAPLISKEIRLRQSG
jgi:ribose-phosphate pyrophosphokinase